MTGCNNCSLTDDHLEGGRGGELVTSEADGGGVQWGGGGGDDRTGKGGAKKGKAVGLLFRR